MLVLPADGRVIHFYLIGFCGFRKWYSKCKLITPLGKMLPIIFSELAGLNRKSKRAN